MSRDVFLTGQCDSISRRIPDAGRAAACFLSAWLRSYGLGRPSGDSLRAKKEDVIASDFFLEVLDTPHFLYLKSWSHPFTRPDGEQGRVQQKLWRLLFHEDCEWPPGSGGISDVPVGGPPELMSGDSTIS